MIRSTAYAVIAILSVLLVMMRSSIAYAVFSLFFLLAIYAFHSALHQIGLIISPEYFNIFFQNAGKVADTFTETIGVNLPINISVTLLAVTLLVLRIASRNRVYTTRAAKWILIAVLLVIPLRIVLKGDVYDYKVKAGQHPIRAFVERGSISGMRYVHASVLGGFEQIEFDKRTIVPSDQELPDDLVVAMIVGETLSGPNMTLFDYERPTTPNLVKRMAEQRPGHLFLAKQGLSYAPSSGATDVQLFNMADHPADQRYVTSDARNIFKLAKQQQFTTRFITPHTYKALYRVYPHNIDELRYQESDYELWEKDRSGFVLKLLPDPIPDGRQFIYIYQWVNHVPFMKHCKGRDEIHIFDVRQDDINLQWRDEYDNGLRCYDDSIEKILQRFDALDDRPFIAFLTSDHGLLLGEYGLRGHGHMHAEGMVVPMMLYTNIPDHPVVQDFRAMTGSHYELTGLLAGALGYDVSGGYDTKQGIYGGGPVSPANTEYLRIVPTGGAADTFSVDRRRGFGDPLPPEIVSLPFFAEQIRSGK